MPHDLLEIAGGDRKLEDALARRPVQAGVAPEQLDIEPTPASFTGNVPQPASERGAWVLAISLGLLGVLVLGLALSVTVGAGVGVVTATVAACVALPPGPVQVIE